MPNAFSLFQWAFLHRMPTTKPALQFRHKFVHKLPIEYGLLLNSAHLQKVQLWDIANSAKSPL